MARAVEIIQHLWCDPCLDTPEGPIYTQAVREVTLAFGLPGKPLKPKVLAVCEIHDKELAPLEEWYRDLAQEDPDKKPPASRVNANGRQVSPANTGDPCVICIALKVPHPSAPTTQEALRQHIAKFHQIGYFGYQRIQEGRYKVTGEYKDGRVKLNYGGDPEEITQCEHCPTRWDARVFENPPRLLTAHIGREHKDLAQAG